MTERQSHPSETPFANGETEVFSAPSTGASSVGEGATRTLPEASAHSEGPRGARPAFARINRPASPPPAKTASRRYRPRLFRRISGRVRAPQRRHRLPCDFYRQGPSN